MKNYISVGERVTITATGNLESGQMVSIGSLFGVSFNKVSSGEKVVVGTIGIYKLPKRSHASEEAISVGDALYLDSDGGDNSTPALSKIATSNGKPVGIAVEDAATGDSEVVVKLRGMAV